MIDTSTTGEFYNPLDLDARVRLAVYRHFVRRVEAPGLADICGEVGETPAAVVASFERLATARVLVLHPETRRIWMAMPFSAIPTGFRVRTRKGEWWANCAWDALGISAMLEVPAEVLSTCSECGDPPPILTTGLSLTAGSGVVHFAVPAAEWWNDIGFT
jgi:alkylmercury lyase-like protein